MLNDDKDVEELGFLYIADGSAKWYDHFVNQFGSFQTDSKAKHSQSHDSNSGSRNVPKRNEYICPQETCIRMFITAIHISQSGDNSMPIHKRINCGTYIKSNTTQQ